MLDAIAVVVLVMLFDAGALYVSGCDRLRGTRP